MGTVTNIDIKRVREQLQLPHRNELLVQLAWIETKRSCGMATDIDEATVSLIHQELAFRDCHKF